MVQSAFVAVLLLAQAKPDDLSPVVATIESAVKSISGYNALKAAKVTDDEAFLKRVMKDLVDAAPTPAELKAFVDDADPKKRANKIDQLVADERFDAFWARRVADVLFPDRKNLRFAWINDLPPGIEPKAIQIFEDWLRTRFKRDLPWTQIVSEVLDARGNMDGDSALAYVASFNRGEGLGKEFPMGVAQHFLGIRLYCARCHDHPFDKWRVEDYYGLGAFAIRQKTRGLPEGFQVKYADEGELMMPTTKGSKTAEVKLAYGGTAAPTFLFGGTADKFDDRMKVLAQFMTDAKNTQLPRALANRVWGWLFGYGIVHPVDDFNLKNKAASPGLLEVLVKDLRDNGYSIKRLVRAICRTEEYQRLGVDEAPEAIGFRQLIHGRVLRGFLPPLDPRKAALPLQFEAPKEWTRLTPRSGALAYWRVPDPRNPEQAAELHLYDKRRDKEFIKPESSQWFKPKASQMAIDGKSKVELSELSGTFFCLERSDGPLDYVEQAAAVTAADGSVYTLRFRGPAPIVTSWREEFLALLKSATK